MKEFKFEFAKVNSKSILVLPSYQRSLKIERVKTIISNFNPNLVNLIKVSYRDGKYYCFDGQHTLKALVMRNGNKDLMVDCKVYYGMTYEDEARLFAEQNGICRAVESNQKLRSLYEAKDIDVIDFKEAVESCGIRCTFKKYGSEEKWTIVCYSCLYNNVFAKYGKSHMIELLKLITEIWEGEASSFRREIISGMNIFMITYKGEFKRDLLVRKLSQVSPLVIVRDGNSIVNGGFARYARAILSIYNKNTSTNRLMDKI